MKNDEQNKQTESKLPVELPVAKMNGKSYYVDSRLRQYRNVENPHDFIDFDQDETVIYSYSRAQALEDSVLVDISELAKEAGFKIPVAVTSAVDVLLNDWRHDGQSFEGRAWDLLMVLHFEIMRAKNTDIIYFAPYFNTHHHQEPKPYKLWAKCGPGDNGEPVITVMLVGED